MTYDYDPRLHNTYGAQPCPTCGHCPTCGRGGSHLFGRDTTLPYLPPLVPNYDPFDNMRPTCGATTSKGPEVIHVQ